MNSQSAVVRRRVFLVDDSEEYLVQAIRIVSETPGLLCAGWAMSGEEVLTALDGVRAELVLLDLRMPGLGGLEVLDRLKRGWPEIKVVLVSLHDESEYRLAAQRAGADGFLAKAELAQTLPTLLDGLFGAAGGSA